MTWGRDEHQGLSGEDHKAARRSGTMNGDGARVALCRVRAQASCDCMRESLSVSYLFSVRCTVQTKRTVQLTALPRAMSNNNGPLLLLKDELAYIHNHNIIKNDKKIARKNTLRRTT